MHRNFRSLLYLPLVLALLLVGKVITNAQTHGEITGVVNDSSGALVSGATVTITNHATNAARKAATNGEGVYAFPSLLPGVYSLKVEQQGTKLLTELKRLQAASSSWLQEAVFRDRGPVD